MASLDQILEVDVKILDPINHLIQIVHYDWAIPKGWWNDLQTGEYLGCDYPNGEEPKGSKSVGDQISLIHTEISESYEGYRKNKADDHCPQFTSLEVELADALIRILDTAGGMKLRLAEAFEAKMEYNRNRPDHNPANRKLADGKKT
jgi:NTP pyrophosphatase (non-canonical NTP hydrolase)